MFSSYNQVQLADGLKRARIRCSLVDGQLGDKIARLKASALDHDKRGEVSLARMDAKSYILQKRQKYLYYTAASICQSLLTLIKAITQAKGKVVPQMVLEPLHTYLYLRDKLQIDEFKIIDKQIKEKFGNIKCNEEHIVEECVNYAATAVSNSEIEGALNEIKGIAVPTQQQLKPGTTMAIPTLGLPETMGVPVQPNYQPGPPPNYIQISNEPNTQQFLPGQSDFIQPSSGIIPPGGFIPPQSSPIDSNIAYPNLDPTTAQPPIIPTNNQFYPPPANNYPPPDNNYPSPSNYPPPNNNYPPPDNNYPPPSNYPPPPNNFPQPY